MGNGTTFNRRLIMLDPVFVSGRINCGGKLVGLLNFCPITDLILLPPCAQILVATWKGFHQRVGNTFDVKFPGLTGDDETTPAKTSACHGYRNMM